MGYVHEHVVLLFIDCPVFYQFCVILHRSVSTINNN